MGLTFSHLRIGVKRKTLRMPYFKDVDSDNMENCYENTFQSLSSKHEVKNRRYIFLVLCFPRENSSVIIDCFSVPLFLRGNLSKFPFLGSKETLGNTLITFCFRISIKIKFTWMES